jgi:hypothetical protein
LSFRSTILLKFISRLSLVIILFLIVEWLLLLSFIFYWISCRWLFISWDIIITIWVIIISWNWCGLVVLISIHRRKVSVLISWWVTFLILINRSFWICFSYWLIVISSIPIVIWRNMIFSIRLKVIIIFIVISFEV